MLGFLGWLVGVPQPVLGLTVLAWGNSIGDYSTNMAMARKGEESEGRPFFFVFVFSLPSAFFPP